MTKPSVIASYEGPAEGMLRIVVECAADNLSEAEREQIRMEVEQIVMMRVFQKSPVVLVKATASVIPRGGS